MLVILLISPPLHLYGYLPPQQKLRLINGLLLPGGSADKSGAFFRTVRRLVRAAMRMNDRGDYFPIYAECLSFEMLAIFLSKVGRGGGEERERGRGKR